MALLRLLEREGRIVQVEPDRYYDTDALASIVRLLRSESLSGRIYAASELRELLGVSRKFLIPLLEYTDRRHITDRHARGRVIRGT
jgi:selenocysteine-specific elongation factor